MAKLTLKSDVQLVEGFEVLASAKNHKITIDEPPHLGGTDKGMNPLELLLSSLGACQTIVAQIYAKKLGVQYSKLEVKLEGDLDPDGFLGKGDVKIGLQEIRYSFHIESDEPEEKIAAFIEQVEKHCPAFDTLINPTNVVSDGVFLTQAAK